jgi:triosephosphate isomerase (TIM)
MRKQIVAGNWKMNTTIQDGIKLAQDVEKSVEGVSKNVITIVCTPFTHLTEVKKQLKKVKIGAQNCAAEAKGAYTGEVSAEMLKSMGVDYCILGHSERRSYYGDTNAILNKKTKLALANNLIPIFCIGEVLAEREASKHFEVVKKQLSEGVFDLSEADFGKIVLAYEPVWAIGTGKTATPEQAQEIHKFIRETIAAKYGKTIADDTTILYGGSCNAQNASTLFSNPDVDGGLIGGAALKSEDFAVIVKSVK